LKYFVKSLLDKKLLRVKHHWRATLEGFNLENSDREVVDINPVSLRTSKPPSAEYRRPIDGP
jgi:hypothetical protein